MKTARKGMKWIGMLLLIMLILIGMAGGAAAETVYEKDGSKIEGIDLFWLTPDSTVDNEGNPVPEAELNDNGSSRHDHLYLATKSDAELSMTYQIEVSFSGQYDYAPGDIQITIPAQVWHARDYSYEDAGMPGIQRIGSMELSVPAAPSTKADFNWQLINGDYVLTNTKTIGATSKAMFQMSITDIVPHTIVDMMESDYIIAQVDVVTNQGNMITRSSNPISAQIDTIAQITGAHKATNNELYEEVPDSIPAGLLENLPEGTEPEDYIYVRWYSYVYHEGNQPFSLDIQDTIGDAYKQIKDANGNVIDKEFVTEGILLGFTNYEGIVPVEGDHDLEANVLKNTYHADTTGSYDHTVYMWSAYKKSDFYVPTAREEQIVYEMHNDIEWILTEYDQDAYWPGYDKPEDEQKETRDSAQASVYYMPTRWSKPTGHFEVFKWTEKQPNEDWNYGYGLNQLIAEEDVNMNFHLKTVGFGYPWTGSRTNPDDEDYYGHEDEPTADEFGNLGWRQITEDFDTFFDNNDTSLTERDFEITYMRVTVPEKMRYQKAGYPRYGYYDLDGNIVYGQMASNQYGYFQDRTLPTPDLQIEYQLNGDGLWHHAATANWGDDGLGAFRFIDVEEGITTEGMKVYFPENTTDVRHIFVSNVYNGKSAAKCDLGAVRWDVYLGIDLKASEENVAIAENWFRLTDTPSTKFRNDVHMFVDGWIKANEDGTPGAGVRLYPDDPNSFFDTSRATIAGASYGVSLSKSVDFDNRSIENGGDNDVESRRAILHYSAELTEQSNLTEREDYDKAVAEGVIPAETKGVWYDLLPVGVTPRMDTIRLREGDVITGKYTIPDYKGTGRILLVVEADLTPDPVQKYSGNKPIGFVDKPTIEFDAVYTWDAIEDYGVEADNYIAFESKVDNLRHNTLGTIAGQRGNPDDPTAGNNKTTPSMPEDVARAMTDLDPNTDESRFVYAKAPVRLELITSALSGIAKAVQNDLVGEWTQGLADQEQVTVYEGQNYTYRLRVSSSESTTTSNIVIYDTIENYHIPDPKDTEMGDSTKAEDFNDKESKKNWQGDWQDIGQWRGTLVSVDLSEFVADDAAPVLYYSLVPDLTFADSGKGSTQDGRLELFSQGAYDLTDSSIWKKAELTAEGKWTVPADVYGKISAVALDARQGANGEAYVLGEGEAVSGYLHMVAPDDNGDPDVWHAKGAYAHKTDAQGNPIKEVDWEKAMVDPANNMYAFNNTRLKCVQTGTSGSGKGESSNIMIRNDYTRVGILPAILKVEKVWQDQNNHDNIRPDEVTVTLLRKTIGVAGDFEPVMDDSGMPMTLTLSESNNWKDYFYQVDVVDEMGNRYAYSFEENDIEGYTLTTEENGSGQYTLINTHPNEQIEVKGEKQWSDNDDALGLRPEGITVKLYRDGEYLKKQTVTSDADGNWSYNFGKLEKYEQGGRPFVYTVEEEYVPKYVASSDSHELLVNDYVPYGDLTVIKTLKDATVGAAEKEFTFTIKLLAEANEDEETVPLMDDYAYKVFRLSADGKEWEETGRTGTVTCSSSFTLKGSEKLVIYDLPSESTYEIEEAEMAGFHLTGKVNDKGTIRAGQMIEAEFTNTYKAEGGVQINAFKQQEGHKLRKGQHKFQLIDKNEGSETYGEVIRTGYNNTPTNWQDAPDGGIAGVISAHAIVNFGRLNYTHLDDGKTFYYEVVEVNEEKPGYTYDDTRYTVKVTVSDNADGTLTVTAVDAATGKDATNPEGTNMPFENRYNAEGAITLKAWKTLDKRKLEEGEFSFELYACNVFNGKPGSEPIATAKNDAEGNIVFAGLAEDGSVLIPELVFDQDDVSMHDDEPAKYSFIIKEVYGTDKTVAYTDQVYKYEVTVYDNHDGTLSFVEGTQSGTREWLECEDCGGAGFVGGAYSFIPMYIMGPDMVCVDPSTAPSVIPYGAMAFENWTEADVNAVLNMGGAALGSARNSLQFEYSGIVACSDCNGTGTAAGLICSACCGSGISDSSSMHAKEIFGNNEYSYPFVGYYTPDQIFIFVQEYMQYHMLSEAQYCDDTCFAVFADPAEQYCFLIQDCSDQYKMSMNALWDSVWFSDIATQYGFGWEEFEQIHGLGGDPNAVDSLEEIAAWYSYLYFLDPQLPSHITSNLTRSDCTTCGGEGRIEGGFNVDGEASMPVFQNDIKPGNLTVTKKVSNDPNPHPEQAFTFKVKFIGELSATPDLAIRRSAASVEDDPALAPKPVDTSRQFHATEEQLQGDPYAVLDKNTGELVIFRSEDGTDHLGRAFDKNTDKWQNGSLVYFTLSETKAYAGRDDWGWSENSGDVRKITMAGAFRPVSTHSMFYHFGNVTELDLHLLDTSHTVDMDSMFCYSGNVELLDLRTFDTSAVEKFGSMFAETRAERIDLSSFDTSKATTLANMFGACRMLKELDLRNFDTSNNTSCWLMMREMEDIEYINFGDFDMSKVTNTVDLFNKTKPRQVALTDNTIFPVYIDADEAFPYDGTWVNVDDPSQTLTGQALFTEGGHGGTWKWNQPKVKINFLRGEGAGSMQSDEIWWEQESYSFVPAFYRFGYELTGFKDAKGTTHPVGNDGLVTINPQDCHQEYVVDLTAVWTPLDEDTATDTNVATFTLKAGETAAFKDLPAYLGYEVWEETPAGWVLVEKVNDAGEIKPAETIKAVFTNEYNPNKAQAALSATKLMDGRGAAGDAFSFKITGPDRYTETVKNVAGGTVQFTPFAYDLDDKDKTYTYTIQEIAGNDSTITYDTAVYTATVQVKDNGEGLLTAAVTYNTADGKAPVFRNTTKPGSLSVSKQISGATPIATMQKFTVEVTFTDASFKPWTGIDGMVNVEGGDPITLENGKATLTLMGGDTVILTDIPAGIRYEARETGSLPGWTMDGTVKEGKIQPTVTDEITFENTYAAKGHAVPEAIKVLEGRTIKEGEFTFGLYDADGNLIDTATTEAVTGKVVFNEITYTEPDLYFYTIKEIIPDERDEAVEYSEEVINVTITVTDEEGKGRLTHAIGYVMNGAEGNTITNKIKPGALKISKTVVSSIAAHKETEFAFTLYLTDAAGQLLSGEYAMSNGDTLMVESGSGTLTLKDGETVTVEGLPDGASYSVVEAAEGGFTQKSTGSTGKIRASQTAAAAFTNTYHAEGEYVFEGMKVLEGKTLEADQFVFELYDSEGYVLESVTNDAEGKFAFKKLMYTEADVGEKAYTISEKNTAMPGVTYDETRYEVKLIISDNGDGTLTVEAVGLPAAGMTFENTYSNETEITVTKQWKGDEENTDARRDITVNLYSKTGNGEKQLVDSAIIPADAEGEELTVKWDKLPVFEVQDGKAVEIEYSVTETMAYGADEKNPYMSTVMGSAREGFTLVNRYGYASVQIVARKDLIGRELAEGQFTFQITDDEGNVVSTAVNNADGTVLFPVFEYTMADILDVPMEADGTRTKNVNLKLEEVNDGQPGYTYDDWYQNFTITLHLDVNGKLTAKCNMTAEETIFRNTYEAEGKVQFEGVKTLTGRDLEEGQFSFTLTGEDVEETVKNDKDGNFTFTEITYDETMLGEYIFTVMEVNDGKPGYTYDDTEYEIVVTVADKGDGTLDVSYTVNGETDTEIAFENVYEAEGKVQFKGSKTLTGRDLEEGQFSFTLTGENVNETVTNDKDGKFVFAEITYDETMLGDHTYTVTEVNDGKAGYTYADTKYEIVVTVADKGDGTLDVSYTVNGEEDAEILFANEYAADATVTISGEKTVGGEEPEDDEVFTFQLKDADGKVLQEVKNDGSSITFDEIPYTLADAGKTYTYTIQESTESNEQYLTDGSVYTVQVTLTDKGDGTLSIDWTLEKDGEGAEKIVFDNTPLSRLDIEKTVIGRAGDQEKPFAFKVTLTDEDGKALKGTFPVEGANVTSIESGSYLHLKHGEKATVKCLPVGTKYLVEEDEYVAFETESKNAEGAITEEGSKAEFVNTLKTVSFSVTKEWQGGDNGLITLTLYENGKKMEPQPTYTESNNVYSYTNLPQYTEEGKAIVYAAKEKYMDGYMTIYRNIAPYAQETDMIYNGGTIVNKAVTSFHVQKVWEGLAEDEEAPEITLTLYCNGEALDKKTPAPNEDGWYIWHNLPLTYKGEAAEYTVAEEPVEGFTVSYGEAAEGEEEPTCARDYGTIVNRKIPKTGDESNIGLWIGLSALSACAFILLMKKRKEA